MATFRVQRENPEKPDLKWKEVYRKKTCVRRKSVYKGERMRD